MDQLPPPGWYPNPAGAGGYRYWDGHNWGQVAPQPAPVLPQQFPIPPPRKSGNTAWVLGGFFLFLIVVLIAGVSMDGRGKRSESSASSSETSHAADFHLDTQSRVINLSFPTGSSVQRGEDNEVWRVPESVDYELASLKGTLPIGKPLNGIAWCESKTDAAHNRTEWIWANGTEWINVAVGNYYPPMSTVPGYGSEVMIARQRSSEGC